MGHNHSHEHLSTKRLYIAVLVNILLTVAQVAGGLYSGSLSLLADALHNFSDAGALAIAAIAARIAHIPANQKMTYGYRRAEILGALINSTSLVVIGIYLVIEAFQRYFNQQPVDGFTVIWVASIALVIDVFTAFLTHSGAKHSINIRAAFIHNVSDAAASVVVILSGIIILLYQVYVVDLIATIIISIYVLFHAFFLIRQSILILMQSTPENLSVSDIKSQLEGIDKVEEVHHIHVWQLDDKRLFLEGHIMIKDLDLASIEAIKMQVKQTLKDSYKIHHTTLEIEIAPGCGGK